MIAIYILTGIVTLLGLLGFFAPIGPSKVNVTFRTDEDDVIFVEDEDLDPADDTQPFIALPFFKIQAAVDGDHDKYGDDEVTQPFVMVHMPPPIPATAENNTPTREFPAYAPNVVFWP